MYIHTLEVAGMAQAIKGMRNPKNSWHLSDSGYENGVYILGEKDMQLAQTLLTAGTEHAKFMRQIRVWADVNMPRYWWSEYDTYKIATNANSCSTMHKLLNNLEPIVEEMFFYSVEDKDIIRNVVSRLEALRIEYLETKDVELLTRAKRLLPEGFLQLRTVDLSYANLRNMYFQRKHHRLKEEWINTFCKWIESLPYAEELIIFEKKKGA